MKNKAAQQLGSLGGKTWWASLTDAEKAERIQKLSDARRKKAEAKKANQK
jgi:hypothetical protein